MKRILVLLLALLTSGWLSAQSGTEASSQESPKKAENLLETFEHGQFNGSFRSFFMATDNARQLSDYYAWAAGGSLYFTSSPWHGFSAGLGGAFNFHVASSDLLAIDAQTGAQNRYEIGLFDVERPENRNDLNRLERLFLRYQWHKSQITVGKQSLQTPFINDQDGRMRPTVESGAWAEWNGWSNLRLEGGWIRQISPRSTVKWYDLGTSIGLYPKGLNPDGTGSGYPENLKSMGAGMLGITKKWGANSKIQVWNQYVENIFNTAFVQIDHVQPLRNDHKWILGIQYTHQDALSHGGHTDASKTYFQKGAQSNIISAQTGWEYGQWRALAAYTHVTSDGRFLSPREWGREPFYTFMQRERIEGSGNSHSATARVQWQNPNKRLKVEAAYGHFYLPDVKAVALNKYAFPSFSQFNVDVRYAFGGMLKGLRVQFLYVRKGLLGNVYGSERYVINKVQMSHYNLVFNYVY
ncbi:MAG: OprD family outer membrane porin [Chitinophagales bacterium]|nr:OprD family outer membrane porin [Chitinophagales bacterium]